MKPPYELALKVIAALSFKNEPVTVKYIFDISKRKIHKTTIGRALRFAVKVNFLTVNNTGPINLYSRGSLPVEEFERLIPDEILNAAGVKKKLLALENSFNAFKQSVELHLRALDAAQQKNNI